VSGRADENEYADGIGIDADANADTVVADTADGPPLICNERG
jgi:hypothetical protein